MVAGAWKKLSRRYVDSGAAVQRAVQRSRVWTARRRYQRDGAACEAKTRDLAGTDRPRSQVQSSCCRTRPLALRTTGQKELAGGILSTSPGFYRPFATTRGGVQRR